MGFPAGVPASLLRAEHGIRPQQFAGDDECGSCRAAEGHHRFVRADRGVHSHDRHSGRRAGHVADDFHVVFHRREVGGGAVPGMARAQAADEQAAVGDHRGRAAPVDAFADPPGVSGGGRQSQGDSDFHCLPAAVRGARTLCLELHHYGCAVSGHGGGGDRDLCRAGQQDRPLSAQR